MADQYFVTHSDMVGVADKIREKSGKSEELVFPEGWKDALDSLSAEELLKASEYPDYVRPSVLDMVNKVRSVQKSDSIISIMMSDSHYPAEQTATTAYASNKASTVQANQAAKALAYILDVDFFAHLGDVCAGAGSTTPDMLKSQIEGFLSYFREAKSDLPVFLAIGNHDAGIYYHNTQTDGKIHTMTGEYLYHNFTSRSASDDTVFDGEEYGGYCYRDFADKKLRVFLLNTSEKLVSVQSDQCTYGSQRVWLANALLDLNNKSDASDWGFIILCHYPADYGGNMPLSELLKAYVEGKSFTITDPSTSYFIGDGTSQTVNFSGKNGARFISQFHGHVHNFLSSRLYSSVSGTPAQYDAWRVCIPNVQFDRENYYGTVSGVDFSQDKTYAKTADSANGTSFVINVINPSEERIYSFCYGAGYDRVIGYGAVTYYSITRSLTNVTSNNTDVSVEEDTIYTEIITPDPGADMQTITVSMGGVDISSTAISIVDGVYSITIPQVTGNVVITAKASLRPNFTNLVPLSINADGTDFYVDGDGYDDGTYINSSGAVGTLSRYVSTGFIPVKTGAKTVRIAGDGISIDGTYTRIVFYDADFKLIVGIPYQRMNDGASSDGVYYSGYEIKEASTKLTWVMDAQGNGHKGVYMRVCTKGDGANLIVTVDEEITYGGTGGDTSDTTCAIIQNLTNVSSSNTSPDVAFGNSFSTVLTANSGYELGSVTVTMGGLDITASSYSSGKITIGAVTGAVIITATAKSVQTSYTNQLAISTDVSGNVYNGTGYKADTYLSGGVEGSRSGIYTSGFIPVKYGDKLYFKNCVIQAEQSNHRFCFYDSSKTVITNRVHNTTSSQLGGQTTPVYGADGNMTQLNIDSGYWSGAAYIRFCCGGLDVTSVVTVNEPIE